MKKVKCLIAIAAFALSMAACSGSRNSTSSGTNGMQNSGTTTNPSGTGTTTDSSQHK